MSKIQKRTVQTTIRNVPEEVERVLKNRAKQMGKTINEVFLDSLIRGSGLSAIKKRDLSVFSGSLSKSEAEKIEKEIENQHVIDERLWK